VDIEAAKQEVLSGKTFTRYLIKCRLCPVKFLQVAWMPHRAAGFCSVEHHEKTMPKLPAALEQQESLF